MLWSMWLDWLFFCDCSFQTVCPLMEKDKRLMEASWWDRLTEVETGCCSDGQGHAQWIFNTIFYWWVDLCPLSAISVQFSSVAQSCPTLCDPMNHSTPGLPVHQQLPEFTQTHVHWVSDTIQPSHSLPSPSLSVFNLSQWWVFSKESVLHIM